MEEYRQPLTCHLGVGVCNIFLPTLRAEAQSDLHRLTPTLHLILSVMPHFGNVIIHRLRALIFIGAVT